MTPAPARPRTSLWAVGSLLASLLLCPPLCLIGPALGAYALRRIRRRPEEGGRGFALAGIGLGLIASAAWIGGAAWWQVNVRRPMLHGPAAALHLAFAGDPAGFRRQFQAAGAGAGDEAVRAFTAALRRRYGRFIAMQPERRGPPVSAKDMETHGFVISYRMRFERAEVPAEARFIITGQRGPPLILKWAWLRVLDADRGDLLYPVPAAPGGST